MRRHTEKLLRLFLEMIETISFFLFFSKSHSPYEKKIDIWPFSVCTIFIAFNTAQFEWRLLFFGFGIVVGAYLFIFHWNTRLYRVGYSHIICT